MIKKQWGNIQKGFSKLKTRMQDSKDVDVEKAVIFNKAMINHIKFAQKAEARVEARRDVR